MNHEEGSPPGGGGTDATCNAGPAPKKLAAPTTNHVHSRSSQVALRRRREASRRLPILEHAGVVDPWQPYRAAPTDQMVGGYRDAILHLRAHGLTAAPDLPSMRVLWCRAKSVGIDYFSERIDDGERDRQLVDEIANRWGLVG
jgi:hypothetical protein